MCPKHRPFLVAREDSRGDRDREIERRGGEGDIMCRPPLSSAQGVSW